MEESSPSGSLRRNPKPAEQPRARQDQIAPSQGAPADELAVMPSAAAVDGVSKDPVVGLRPGSPELRSGSAGGASGGLRFGAAAGVDRIKGDTATASHVGASGADAAFLFPKASSNTDSGNNLSEDNTMVVQLLNPCLLYTSPSPRDLSTSRMPSSA